MRLYRLPFVLREPNEETEDRYLAEVPALPGCRAWGETAAEALENLQSVATAFVESYRARGDSLPAEIEALASESGPHIEGEVVIAARTIES